MATSLDALFEGVQSAVAPALKGISDAVFGTKTGNQAAQESYRASEAQQDIITKSIRTVTATREMGEAATQKTMLELSIAASDDGVGIASSQARLIGQYKQIEDARAQKLNSINAKRNISPADDLFGWLHAQFTLDSDIAEYNGEGDKANQAFNELQGLNQLVDSSWQSQQKVMQTKTAASAQAAADEAAAKSEQARQVFQREGVVANSKAMQEIAGLTAQQMVIKNNAFSAAQQMEHLQLARQQVNLAIAAGKRDEQRLEEFIQEKDDKRAAVQDTFNMIRRGMIAIGATNDQLEQVTPQYVRNVIAGRTPQDPKLQQYLRLGNMQLSAGVDSDSRLLGLSPSDSLQTIGILNPRLSDDAKQTYERILIQARDEIIMDKSPNGQALMASKDKVQIERVINDRANALLKADEKRTGDPRSIYYLPAIKDIAERLPNITQMKIWDAALGDAVKAGVNLSDPANVQSLIWTAVRESKVDITVAAKELAALYGTAQKQNLISKQVVNLGLDSAPTYFATGFNGKLIDFTDELQIKKDLMTGHSIGFKRIPGTN
jgi:hypothetical protein